MGQGIAALAENDLVEPRPGLAELELRLPSNRADSRVPSSSPRSSCRVYGCSRWATETARASNWFFVPRRVISSRGPVLIRSISSADAAAFAARPASHRLAAIFATDSPAASAAASTDMFSRYATNACLSVAVPRLNDTPIARYSNT